METTIKLKSNKKFLYKVSYVIALNISDDQSKELQELINENENFSGISPRIDRVAANQYKITAQTLQELQLLEGLIRDW